MTGDIERFLQAMIERMEPVAPARGPGHPVVLPALALWSGLLVCVLKGFDSQLAIWRLLRDRGLWRYPRFPVTDQAVYKRLAKGGTAPLEQLLVQVSTVLAERVPVLTTLAPFAQEVVTIDESTLDQIARTLPALRGVPPGDDRLLPGKLAGVFDIRRQQWRQVQYIEDRHQNEKVAARDLVAGLPAGSLVLADLGYFGFAWFDWLTDHGYWWVSRLRAKTSYTVIHRYYEQGDTFDGLVWLGAYRADRAAHAVRLVSFRVGQVVYRYITNVCEPERLSLLTIAQVYARRWDFELAVLLVKRHLRLHLLWSAKPVVIRQQLWAVLIIAQVLQALRLDIADRAGVDPFDVSMALLVTYLPYYAAEGCDPIAAFLAHGRELRFIRPSRRTQIRAPTIPDEAITPLPPDVVLVRTPRYAERKCDRHAIPTPKSE